MKPAELRSLFAVCRDAGVAAIEIDGDNVKVQFFPPMPSEIAPPRGDEPSPPEPKTPDPDVTLMALQAQRLP